jgi:hypothetical protein
LLLRLVEGGCLTMREGGFRSEALSRPMRTGYRVDGVDSNLREVELSRSLVLCFGQLSLLANEESSEDLLRVALDESLRPCSLGGVSSACGLAG